MYLNYMTDHRLLLIILVLGMTLNYIHLQGLCLGVLRSVKPPLMLFFPGPLRPGVVASVRFPATGK